MEITIQIPDHLPEEFVARHVRELEEKLWKEAKASLNAANERRAANDEDAARISGKVKQLVEDGNISEARRLIAGPRRGASPEMDRWRMALAFPKAKQEKSATAGRLREDIEWLQNHGDAHQGKWVALKDGSLLGSHESQVALYHDLKQSGRLADAMFFKLENQRLHRSTQNDC